MPNPNDAVMRPFGDFLREQAQGRTHEELTQALYDVVNAVEATGKAGSLTLTLSIQPLKDTAGGVIKVTDKVKTSLPEFARPASIFFADAGNLVRDNPNQLRFDGMRDVSASEPAEREPDARERQAGGLDA